jgi:hypothetical protein
VTRRHLAVWATHPTTLAIGGAVAGTTVGLWLLLVAGPIPLLGAAFITTQLLIPHPAHVRRVAPQAPASGVAVAAGVAAPAPGWGAGAGAARLPLGPLPRGAAAGSGYALPAGVRPASAGKGGPSTECTILAVAPAAAARPNAPTRILAGWAGRPAVGPPFPRGSAAGRHRSGGTQLPARRANVVYTVGRAAVRGATQTPARVTAQPGRAGSLVAAAAAAADGRHQTHTSPARGRGQHITTERSCHEQPA